MKFGGTSVGNLDKINNVANIVEKESKSNKIIVVLSAMAGVTNQLQNYLESIKLDPSPESDLVLTSGEHVTVGILSAVLKKNGIFVSKIFMGTSFNEIMIEAKSAFYNVKVFKPKSSRKDSKESFIVCKNLKKYAKNNI